MRRGTKKVLHGDFAVGPLGCTTANFTSYSAHHTSSVLLSSLSLLLSDYSRVVHRLCRQRKRKAEGRSCAFAVIARQRPKLVVTKRIVHQRVGA